MSPVWTRRAVYAALFGAYVLHNDLWLWDDPTMVWGLPVGLAYHVGFCFASAALMALLVRFAWPEHRLGKEERPEAP